MANILVVDDELGIRDLLFEILNDEGHTVELAENAAQARAARQLARPDLVLLDIWMPDTDGVSLLKEWATLGLLNMPVIMMSGHATIDTAVEATRIGAMAFLEKPITLQKLLKAVEQALQKKPNLAPASGAARASMGSGQAMGASAGGNARGGTDFQASLSRSAGFGSGQQGSGLGSSLGSSGVPGGHGFTSGLHAGAGASALAAHQGGSSLGSGMGGGAQASHSGAAHAGASGLSALGAGAGSAGLGGYGPGGLSGLGSGGVGGFAPASGTALGGTQQVFELDQPLREARDAFEKAYFEFHLVQEGGSMTRVAEKTGLERTHLYRKLKQLGVDLSKTKRSLGH